MPHDFDGKALLVDDVVLIPARVKRLYPGQDYCNAELETVIPMPPGDAASTLSLNCRQTLKYEPGPTAGMAPNLHKLIAPPI